MEVGWAGSAPHFIYTHHTSLTAPAHLLFACLFRFLAHGIGFVVVSPLDLLADTDDNEAGNETRTHASADMTPKCTEICVSIQLAEISMYLDFKLLASFRRVLESLSPLAAQRMTICHGYLGSMDLTEKWSTSCEAVIS